VNESSDPIAPRSALPRLLVPLAALAAMAAFAGRDADPAGMAEGIYLAVLAAAALLPVALLAPAPALELGLGSVLSTAAVWAFPRGPARGAVVVLVVLAALAVAAARRLWQEKGREDRGLSPALAIPLALGCQALLRGELLFAPGLTVRTLVALLALPVAGALAVAYLASRRGTVLALVAAGTALALAPGFNVASTLALLALAAGDVLGRRDAGLPARAAALLVVAAPIAWEPGPGVATALCGLALASPLAALALGAVAAGGMAVLFEASRDGMILQFAALPLLVPAALVPERGRSWNVLTAGLLVATVPLVPDLSALAAPLALAALSMRSGPAFTVPQRVWTGAVLGGTAILASYPWLRPEPMTAALSLLGLPAGPGLAVWAAAVFLALAGLGAVMGRVWEEPVRSARLAGLSAACLTLALLQGLPNAGTPLLVPELPVVLDSGNPSWEADLPGQPVGSVVVESSLANGAALPAGTPVATVKLRDRAGRSVGWTLRAGQNTGEWAARRPDVARAGGAAPQPWISWVAGDFFAQRYRARLRLARRGRFVHLRVERAPGVPQDLEVAVYQMEVRR
jgi:hypothetical protein